MCTCASRADWGVLQLLRAALLQLINAGGGKEKVLQGEMNLPGEGISARHSFNGIWKQIAVTGVVAACPASLSLFHLSLPCSSFLPLAL